MRALGICGCVSNRADNSVEAVIERPSEMIEAAIATARQGYAASRVADVAISDEPSGEIFAGFEKRATF